jgi:hypothetical protein
MSVSIVYFDHATPSQAVEPPFSSGEAGVVWIESSGDVVSAPRVPIPPNSLHAMHGHGVVRQLNALDPLIGPVGAGSEAVISPAMAEQALRIFYEADRMTYGSRHDLLVRAPAAHDLVEYRIVIDNREYQRTLSRLQYMTSTAARMGQGIMLRV